nr:MAG TPA: hypothetical protein [Caudoviricetes sp.]
MTCGDTPLYISTVYGRMTAGEIMHQIVDTAKKCFRFI